MNAIGWILIILLILVILGGIGLLIYYFVKIKPDQDKKKVGPNGPTGDPNPTDNVKSPLSILTNSGKPEYALTSLDDKVILMNPEGPTGSNNICSNYKWNYSGPTGSLEASWITTTGAKYMGVAFSGANNTPADHDKVIMVGPTGPTGPTGSFLDPTTTQWTYDKSGLWCLTNSSEYCLYHTAIGATGATGATGPVDIDGQQLQIRHISTANKATVSDKGFLYSNLQPLSVNGTTPKCRIT